MNAEECTSNLQKRSTRWFNNKSQLLCKYSLILRSKRPPAVPSHWIPSLLPPLKTPEQLDYQPAQKRQRYWKTWRLGEVSLAHLHRTISRPALRAKWLPLCITTGCHPQNSHRWSGFLPSTQKFPSELHGKACWGTWGVNKPWLPASPTRWSALLSGATNSKSLHCACHKERPAWPGWLLWAVNTGISATLVQHSGWEQLSSCPGGNGVREGPVPPSRVGVAPLD